MISYCRPYAHLVQLQLYAETTDTCRHILICRYFGEKIDNTKIDIQEAYCEQMCDVSRQYLPSCQHAYSSTSGVRQSSSCATPSNEYLGRHRHCLSAVKPSPSPTFADLGDIIGWTDDKFLAFLSRVKHSDKKRSA